jgi:hypothetical protein
LRLTLPDGIKPSPIAARVDLRLASARAPRNKQAKSLLAQRKPAASPCAAAVALAAEIQSGAYFARFGVISRARRMTKTKGRLLLQRNANR